MDRVSHDVNWGPTVGDSARYWSDSDTIGVLHDRMTGFVSLTHNGVLKADVVRLPSHRRLVPGVCIGAAGTRLYVNFGQRAFKFPFAQSRYVPASLGGTMSADTHRAEADVDSDSDLVVSASASASASSSSAATSSSFRPRGDERASARNVSSSSSDASSSDPVAAKKKALLEAEEAEKKAQAAREADANEEEEKKSEEQPTAADGSASSGASAEAKDGEEKSEEKSAEQSAADDNTARRREARSSAGDAGASGVTAPADQWDAWQSEDEFSEEEGGDDSNDEGDASTAEEDEDLDNNDYDEYGRRQSRKKARLPPLTVDSLEVGMVVSIKAPVAKTDAANDKAARRAARRSARNGNKMAKATQQADKLVGTVVQVSQMKRSALLSIYMPESGLAQSVWVSIASIARFKPRINADLHAAIAKERQPLRAALEHESCLAKFYAQKALLTIIGHSFHRRQDGQGQAAASSSSVSASVEPALPAGERDVELSLDDVGGAVGVCAAVKRAALDQAREGTDSSSSSADADGASGADDESTMPSRPVDVWRRFLLNALRSSSDERLAELLCAEAVGGLAVGSDSTLSWMERIKSKEHVSYGCWLVDLLLSVQTTPEPTPHAQSLSAPLTRSHLQTMPVFSIEVK